MESTLQGVGGVNKESRGEVGGRGDGGGGREG